MKKNTAEFWGAEITADKIVKMIIESKIIVAMNIIDLAESWAIPKKEISTALSKLIIQKPEAYEISQRINLYAFPQGLISVGEKLRAMEQDYIKRENLRIAELICVLNYALAIY